ncbi:methylamine utilization protein MauJ [uncultured Paludibaculum sp.]|uniref:methylamine utilization protein MauJ n=1 Tax=uncultured Paludibaculum sp. TaxID=1765020 RepID=UPI002AABCB08|nr:methylamine utilization protein MauJ [uncultured Paludibaculum sp.]
MLPEEQVEFAAELKGDSHLAILGPAYTTRANQRFTQIRVYGGTPQGQFAFDGYPNRRGFLGKVVLQSVQAETFDDAELKAYRALAPSLSMWSLYRDIPLHIAKTDSEELATGNTRTSFVNPVVEAAWAVPPRGTISDELRRYASLYREALNSNTPAYQFLCFFKIIEGVQSRRARLNSDARSRGLDPKRYHERIPENRADCEAWLNAIFYGRPPWDPMSLDEIFRPEILGKKLSRLIEAELRPLRVKVAHAILDSGEPAHIADEGLDIQNLTRWLPLAKCIVRRMLKNEFAEFLPFVDEDGIVHE